MTIRDIIQQIVRATVDVDFGIPCEVFDYTEDGQTISCSPIDGRADFLKVRLQADPKSGALLIPKIGSIVIVEQTSHDSAFVSLFGELEEIIFLDGDNGGVVKVSELVEKLNNIENWISQFKPIYEAHSHPTAPTGPISPPTSIPIVPAAPTLTTEQELENENFKH